MTGNIKIMAIPAITNVVAPAGTPLIPVRTGQVANDIPAAIAKT
jgi:hypothetical protein